jgi:hypothetical protein
MRQQDGPAPTASFPRRSELRADLGIGRPDNPTPPAAPVDWPATAVVHLLARGGRAVTGLCPRPSRRGFHVKHIYRSAQPERLRPPRPESPTPQPHRNAQCGQTAKGPSPVNLIERRFDPANDPVRFTAGPAEALDRAAPKAGLHRSADAIMFAVDAGQLVLRTNSRLLSKDERRSPSRAHPRTETAHVDDLRDGCTRTLVPPNNTMERRARVTRLVLAPGRGGPRGDPIEPPPPPLQPQRYQSQPPPATSTRL